MWSNVLTVTAYAPFGISAHVISGPSRVPVGQATAFRGTVGFTTASPVSRTLYIDVYVNDRKVDTRTYTVSAGLDRYNYSFTLTFRTAGTYRVKCYARLG